MGNPSDGFHGKTISLSIKNFWAEVTIIESKELVGTPVVVTTVIFKFYTLWFSPDASKLLDKWFYDLLMSNMYSVSVLLYL